jgi:hypothetical protein
VFFLSGRVRGAGRPVRSVPGAGHRRPGALGGGIRRGNCTIAQRPQTLGNLFRGRRHAHLRGLGRSRTASEDFRRRGCAARGGGGAVPRGTRGRAAGRIRRAQALRASVVAFGEHTRPKRQRFKGNAWRARAAQPGMVPVAKTEVSALRPEDNPNSVKRRARPRRQPSRRLQIPNLKPEAAGRAAAARPPSRAPRSRPVNSRSQPSSHTTQPGRGSKRRYARALIITTTQR